MALRLRKTRSDDDFRSAKPRETTFSNKSEVNDKVDCFGRPTPPPPLGSSYDAFLDWASEESLDPSEADRDLAMSLWMGITPVLEYNTPKLM